ncbi:TonB-dependent receptor [Xanthomonas arboricola]|uniref:TonB-dependent receptor n=1 Tax=Xanthomonas arboricola TaxID=56448 RepID=UPI0004752A7F|nr:TonB-dependent receptor [Xanthomonas arboricola]MDN0243040.1 TonB-dependent receptor [Xanthomonas arboricola pv. juglandis]MDN0255750.1 TonB-dependent receptor [Xanthomonas arboricola pv. juglandis]MDN0259745.1 TonB-dependent receptor [Xanthomonas arboricola pv. juglandis]MDN0263721.1 TonB-dependent receptor [Xanthomonas arboricola pv. juglandis]MDN0280632.1 TonB-dependent receptor [Xanthomonas arboricola pv. juglandis]
MYKFSSHASAGTGVHARRTPRLRHSAMAVSIGLLLAAPVYAQQAQSSQAASSANGGTSAVDLDTVEVRGVRASLIKSQVIKRDASQIVDSVSAEDIGALPDRSVTETLQRVSGVTIDHFAARSDPDHFSAEGSGVMIRGLTQVRGELNGRDIFSAASGRGLSFEDVPAELMAGVDVYKNPSAEIIEGGLGGTVNLRTRMPFDNPGRIVGGNVDYNYGDMSKKYKPSASFLFSDRWNTGIGEMGFMIDVAHSELATRSDGIQVEPYVRRTDEAVLAGSGRSEVFVPGGVNWRQLDFERKRDGIAAAFQWKPSDATEIYAQFLRSRYEMNWQERAAFFNDSNNSITPAPGTTFDYDDRGAFLRGSPVSSSWRGVLTGDGVRFNTDNRYSEQRTTTTDMSVGFSHFFNDNLQIKGDMQLVESENEQLDFTVFSATYLPGLSYDVSGKYPSVQIANPGFTQDPSNYFWAAAMDHLGKNRGRQLSTRVDLEYTFDDSSWLRFARFGMRATDRNQINKNSGYNWGVISDNWAAIPGTSNGLANMSEFMTDQSSLFTFSDFFRGGVNVPTTLVVPNSSLVNNYRSASQMIQQIVALRGYGWAPDTYQPQDTNRQHERTQAAYAALYFGNDEAWGVPVDGNIGIRVVQTKTQAEGFGQFQNLAGLNVSPELQARYTGQYFENDSQGSYTNVLPSLNLRLRFTDSLQWRFAASKAMARPDYTQLQPYVLLNVETNDAGQATDFVGTAGNPNLKPMVANQFDTALEWYFDTSDMLYATLFYKKVKDYFSTQTRSEIYDNRPWLVTRPYNMDEGTIRGAELGYTQFFDQLPGWLSGFGVNANFTFVDSQGGANTATDPYTNTTVTGVELPLEGLSRRSYNLAGIYEKGPLSLRLAYNWRSRYLLTTSDASTRLPTWADDYGQLDGSFFYRFNEHLQLGVQANNLTNTVTRVLMGPTSYEGGEVDPRLYTRSSFVNDRRYSLVLRMNW